MRKKTCGIYYAAGGVLMVGLKCYYSQASCDGLRWMLAPVAGWVRILSGHAFTYLPGIGYVNHSLRFLIAPACCGVQFLIIAMGMLLFSFLRDMDTTYKRILWTVCSLAGAYGYTIFVNGIRITLSIVLPPLLAKTTSLPGWLTPERLHTIIGISTYFTCLLLLHQMAAYLIGSGRKKSHLWPVLWYLLVVLLLPAAVRLLRPYQGNRTFAEYTLLVTATCLLMLTVIRILTALGRLCRHRPGPG